MSPPANGTNRPHNLPRQLTPFLGRQTELTQILEHLADPTCCLLTLVGPGGIGKTRLALEAAQAIVDCRFAILNLNPADHPKSNIKHQAFEDGIFFVNLQPLDNADLLASAVCDTLALPLAGHEPPQTQLLHYLHAKRMLLVLDNFEQLLAGTEFLTRLLQAAPQVNLLVTSREALNLQEEWLLRVGGLTFPPLPDHSPGAPPPSAAEVEESAQIYSAVQLFTERAQRVRPTFALHEEADEVVQICRLVEGMPLALELAATWAKTMRCAEIAAEIQRRTDFLATSLRNLPERHRSIQAVFDHSWLLLSEQERSIFQKLAVFRGGFSRQAVEEVAGATLPLLSTLVDKSFLRWEPDGRYQIHELLRQAAQEQLAQHPGAAEQVQSAHGHYFAHFAEQCYQTLQGAQQAQFPTVMSQELENLRYAWRWALQTMDLAAIEQLADPLQQYYDLRGRCLESVTTLAAAVARLEPRATERQPALTLAFILTLLGWTYVRVGQLAEAKTAFERSQALYDQWNASPRMGFTADPEIGLANLANVCGQYQEALQLAEAARQRHDACADQGELQVVHYVLANAHFALGHYDQAGDHAQRAYALTQATGNRWFGAFVLSDLGHVARVRGDLDQARHYYQESYATKAAFADQEGMALALNNLAKVALLEADSVQAEKLYQQSLAIYRKIDDQGGLATVLSGLGETACAFGNLTAARRYFREALQITLAMHYWPLTLAILVGSGELLLLTGQRERAGELFTLALTHPAGQQETRKRAETALQQARLKPAETTRIAATQVQNEQQFIATVEALVRELATPTAADEPASAPAQPLIEPLTERELEVLHLLAEGLSNQEIADHLVIAKGTVKSYTGAIYGKLGVRSRTQAVARARTLTLLT